MKRQKAENILRNVFRFDAFVIEIFCANIKIHKGKCEAFRSIISFESVLASTSSSSLLSVISWTWPESVHIFHSNAISFRSVQFINQWSLGDKISFVFASHLLIVLTLITFKV